MKIPINRTIQVFWHDHTSNDGWATLDEIKTTAESWYDSLCNTTGTCIVRTNKYIVIAGEYDGEDNYSNYTLILRNDIDHIKIFK